jgi:DNA-binding transcriptional LysR family regulator
MEIDQVEAFVAIVQTGGFSSAAQTLHLSQPANSRRISLLEQELGTTLFERLHNRIVLTPSGAAFLPHAQRVLAAMGDGIQAVQAVEQQAQGHVTLALVGTLASTAFLMARLMRFRTAHPEVKLILRTARSSEVSDMVRSGEAHLGLRYFVDPDAKLVSQVVDHEPVVVVCSAQSPVVSLNHIYPDDLRGLPWVSFPLGQGSSGELFAQLVVQRLHALGLHEPDIIAIDSLTAQKRLIEADFGIGLLPVSSIQEELALGTLHILDSPDLRAAVPVVVLHRQDGYLSKAARTLLDNLLDPAE